MRIGELTFRLSVNFFISVGYDDDDMPFDVIWQNRITS